MLAIAEQLVAREYEVCFISGSGYRQQAEEAGASFVAVEGYGDFHDLTSWDLTHCVFPPSDPFYSSSLRIWRLNQANLNLIRARW